MKCTRWVPLSMMLTALLGVLPHGLFADGPAVKTQQLLDVALHGGGLLIGQVVDRQGNAKQGVEVGVLQKGQELTRAKTDQLGRFAIKGMRGGSYQLVTADTKLPVRAWTKSVAPPSVNNGALLVEGETMRGQYAGSGYAEGTTGYVGGSGYAGTGSVSGGGGLFGFGGFRGLGAGGGGVGAGLLSSPWVVGGVVAGLVAIPIIEAQDDDDEVDSVSSS